MNIQFWILSILVLLFFVLAVPVMAGSEGDDEAKFDCENDTPVTTFDMRECASYSYEKADKELNEVYKKLIASYEQALKEEQERSDEGDDLDYVRQRFETLRQSQRDWIKFRDSFCDFEASHFWGGTVAPWVYISCLTVLTEQQTERLRGYLEMVE